MERDELIPLVSTLLAAATARNDLPIMMVCEELGRRLVEEGETPNAATQAIIAEAQCPACAARRAKRTELQRKWRHSKKPRTTKSSQAAIEEGTKIYSGTLKRLAKR